jgi:hypothetical protein
MNIKTKLTCIAVIAACAGCAQLPVSSNSSTSKPAASTAQSPVATGPKLFADFGKFPKTSNQGSELLQTVYSERRGDAQISSLEVVGNTVVMKGQIGNSRGSQWAGVGFMVSHNNTSGAETIDLSAYKFVKVNLASNTVNTIRVRISGDDPKALTTGCYPIVMQAVTNKLTEYTIPISKFEPEAYCESNARSIKSTINKVAQMEFVDSNNKTNKPTEFSVGKVEFIQ